MYAVQVARPEPHLISSWFRSPNSGALGRKSNSSGGSIRSSSSDSGASSGSSTGSCSKAGSDDEVKRLQPGADDDKNAGGNIEVMSDDSPEISNLGRFPRKSPQKSEPRVPVYAADMRPSVHEGQDMAVAPGVVDRRNFVAGAHHGHHDATETGAGGGNGGSGGGEEMATLPVPSTKPGGGGGFGSELKRARETVDTSPTSNQAAVDSLHVNTIQSPVYARRGSHRYGHYHGFSI